MNLILNLLFFLILGSSFCYGYRILAIFPFHGKSHWNFLQQVAKVLAVEGNQIDVVSHFPQKNKLPNYTDIVRLPKVGDPPIVDYQILQTEKDVFEEIHYLTVEMCEYLQLPELADLIQNQRRKPTYDLLIVHYLFGHQCFTGIGHLLKIPVVGVVTSALTIFENKFVGSPLNLGSGLSFWDRLTSVVQTYSKVDDFYGNSKDQQYYISKYLGADIPHYSELERSISLLLANSHFSFGGIRPKVPAIVEIGGIHITEDGAKIEPGLKKILDESKDGFIMLSFGSMVKLESFPKEILSKFYAAFRKVAPIRVIVRVIEPDLMPKNLPDNVYLYKWLPQQQILQHPNIKGFATHGGAHGVQEAMYYAVPMICIPLFADQFENCDIATSKNIAVKLDFQSGLQEDYDRAFEQISTNSDYKEASKKMSRVFRDRPWHPKKEAVYWIEYVIRNGKNALKSPTADLKWWQIENVDVYAFITTIVLSILSLTIYIIYLVFKMKAVKDKSETKKLN